MRKSFIPFFTLCLCLCLLCGCGAAAQPDEDIPAAEDKAGNGLALTQTQAVSTEKYLGQDEFAPFLSRAEKAYLIPGLNEAAIPSGHELLRGKQPDLYLRILQGRRCSLRDRGP